MIFSSDSQSLTQYVCHSRTHRGHRSENQDACGHWQDDSWLIGVVADGAGGHAGGRLASSLAVHQILNSFRSAPTAEVQALRKMVYDVNEVLLARQVKDPSCCDMHSTVVAVILNKKTGCAVRIHAGDSRLYSFDRNGFVLLTEDHSMKNLLRQNDSEVEQITSRHTLYSALGEPSNSLKLDVELLPATSASYSLMLCTDGFWEYWMQLDSEQSLQWPITRESIDSVFDYMQENLPGRCDNFSVLAIYSEIQEEV